jgi:hypothetical protein
VTSAITASVTALMNSALTSVPYCSVRVRPTHLDDGLFDQVSVLERLPTQPASRIGELLPHRWKAS